MRQWIRIALAAVLAVSACAAAARVNAAEPATAGPAPRVGAWGFEQAGVDKKVKPGDDFFRYAVGG